MDLEGNILRLYHLALDASASRQLKHIALHSSPGFLDIQINGAYGFDFSVYKDDDSYITGLKMVAERIVETGVTG